MHDLSAKSHSKDYPADSQNCENFCQCNSETATKLNPVCQGLSVDLLPSHLCGSCATTLRTSDTVYKGPPSCCPIGKLDDFTVNKLKMTN